MAYGNLIGVKSQMCNDMIYLLEINGCRIDSSRPWKGTNFLNSHSRKRNACDGRHFPFQLHRFKPRLANAAQCESELRLDVLLLTQYDKGFSTHSVVSTNSLLLHIDNYISYMNNAVVRVHTTIRT